MCIIDVTKMHRIAVMKRLQNKRNNNHEVKWKLSRLSPFLFNLLSTESSKSSPKPTRYTMGNTVFLTEQRIR